MSNFPIIESVRLRFIELSDNYIEQIFEYASDKEVTKYVSWKRHRTIADTLDFLNWSYEQRNNPNYYNFGLVIKESNEFIGTIGISNYLPDVKSVDFGYVLNKKYWGKGLATEAVKTLCEFGFNLDEIDSMQAYVFEENKPSCRVLKKCGFSNCGTSKYQTLSFPEERITLRYELRKSDYIEKQSYNDII
jgi:ribosomal-protein-alanine N-acetyltransferase